MTAVTTPCYGKHDLFDSTEIEDHKSARALCGTCPVMVACMRNLADVKQAGGYYGRPQGTWAGQLQSDLGPYERHLARRSDQRVESDDLDYDSQQARAAHTSFLAGKRDEWTRTGERVYQARRKRAERAAKAVA